MNQERKKAEVKPAVTPVVPKKRETTETKVELPKIELPKVVEETQVKEDRKRKSDFKTLRIAMNANIEERKQIADRTSKGELTFAYYAIDGDNGYHYYYINKN